MNDTRPAITARHHATLMARSPEERFIMGALMFDAARDMALASIAAETPHIEARTRYFLRFYQEDFPAETREQIIDWLKANP